MVKIYNTLNGIFDVQQYFLLLKNSIHKIKWANII